MRVGRLLVPLPVPVPVPVAVVLAEQRKILSDERIRRFRFTLTQSLPLPLALATSVEVVAIAPPLLVLVDELLPRAWGSLGCPCCCPFLLVLLGLVLLGLLKLLVLLVLGLLLLLVGVPQHNRRVVVEFSPHAIAGRAHVSLGGVVVGGRRRVLGA